MGLPWMVVARVLDAGVHAGWTGNRLAAMGILPAVAGKA